MRGVFFAVAACAAVALPVLTLQAAAAEPKCGAETHQRFEETRAYFKDVLGACRPDGYCSAVIAIADRSGAAYRHQMRIARPTPGAPHEVEFVAVDPMPSTPAAPMALTIGRDRFALSAANTESVNEFRVTDATMAQAIVARAKRGASAVWTYQSEVGPAAASFPLRGLTSALTWIDCMGEG